MAGVIRQGTYYSYRKVPGTPTFYGVIVSDGRLVWLCPHSHERAKLANRCAKRHVANLTVRGRLQPPRRVAAPTRKVVIRTAEDGKPILSRTYIENFLQCVQYQNDTSPEAAFGNVIHDAIHAYWQLCVAQHQESRLGDVDAIVREAFFREANGVSPERYDEALDLVHHFASDRLADLSTLLVVERRPAIEFTMRGDGGWFWAVGRADRIDRTDGEDTDDPPRVLRVTDYKTGWPTTTQRIPDAPSNGSGLVPHEFQRRFYAMLAFLDPRLNPVGALEAVETVIDYPRASGEGTVITYERDQLDVWWQDMMWALAQRWQQRDGPPTGSDACTYCAARLFCGASLTDARAIPASVEEAREQAQEWIRLKAAQTGRRKALKAYFTGRDLMVINGLEIGFAKPRTAAWKASNPLGIVNYLNAQGLEGEKAMVTWIDAKLIPNKMKAPMVEAGVARWEPGPAKFGSRKAGSDEETEE